MHVECGCKAVSLNLKDNPGCQPTACQIIISQSIYCKDVIITHTYFQTIDETISFLGEDDVILIGFLSR